MIYQSKFKGAQIDELLEKVQKGDVSQYPIKEVLDGEELVPIYDGENKVVRIDNLGSGITVVDSVDKLDPNAKKGSIAAVIMKGRALMDPRTAPVGELDSSDEYIFSDNLIKVEDIDVDIIKRSNGSFAPPFIELYNFDSKYYISMFVSTEGVVFQYVKDWRGEVEDMYYYDASSDKVNLDVLNNIKTLLKNENFYFVYCEGGNNPERFDWTYNTFQLYSETDKVELYKKESEWQPLLESSSSENVIEIANSVHNLNPNAKEGSIASVVTGGKTLIDVKKAPLCRIELGEYIFSEDLVKVDDIDINIIKQTLSYEDCPDGIELYDFNSQYCLIFRVENEGIKYMHFKEYSEDMPAIFYYDSATDTVNSTVIDDIREILKNGDYRITHYSSVSYGYSQELIDWLFNTFQLYSGTDSKVELYKKEGNWKPLQSNVENDFINANTPIKETITGEELVPLYDGNNKAIAIKNLIPKEEPEDVYVVKVYYRTLVTNSHAVTLTVLKNGELFTPSEESQYNASIEIYYYNNNSEILLSTPNKALLTYSSVNISNIPTIPRYSLEPSIIYQGVTNQYPGIANISTYRIKDITYGYINVLNFYFDTIPFESDNNDFNTSILKYVNISKSSKIRLYDTSSSFMAFEEGYISEILTVQNHKAYYATIIRDATLKQLTINYNNKGDIYDSGNLIPITHATGSTDFDSLGYTLALLYGNIVIGKVGPRPIYAAYEKDYDAERLKFVKYPEGGSGYLEYVFTYDYLPFDLSNNELNLELVANLNTNQVYDCTIDGTKGIYENGTITSYFGNKIYLFNVNLETGEITEKLNISIETLAGLDARIKALESN